MSYDIPEGSFRRCISSTVNVALAFLGMHVCATFLALITSRSMRKLGPLAIGKIQFD